MNKFSTLDNLILFAYNEAGTDKTGEIIKTFRHKKELFKGYKSIVDIQRKLDDIGEEPSENTISNIMNYSKALNVFKLKPDRNTSFVVVN